MGEGLFSAEQLRSDLTFLYETLQSAHYDLFAQTPRAEFDRYYKDLEGSLGESMDLEGARAAFQRFLALARIGHTRIETPSPGFAEHLSSQGRILPLFVRVRGGRTFVRESSGQPQLRDGDEILEVDGVAADRWLQRVMPHISAESDAFAHAILELELPRLLWQEFGALPSAELRVRSAGSPRAGRVVTLDAVTLEEMRQGGKEAPPRLELGWTERSWRMLDGEVAYLRPGPFFEPDSDVDYDESTFEAFVDGVFEQIIEDGVGDLIIDLRDNPGGDNSFSDLMIAWFADEPFRFCSSYRVRVSAATRASNARRLAADPAPDPEGSSSRYAKLFAEHSDGEVVAVDLPLVEPRKGRRFDGEVYVLINRRSFSNAVSAAALMQDYGFATLLGEATSDIASAYGGMERFSLPETGLEVGYPKARMVRPNGDGRLLGVEPDVAIETPLVEGSEDPVLQAALALVRQARSPN